MPEQNGTSKTGLRGPITALIVLFCFVLFCFVLFGLAFWGTLRLVLGIGVVLVVYGIVVVIFKYPFGVHLWNPFG
jgi:hypothetical protein